MGCLPATPPGSHCLLPRPGAARSSHRHRSRAFGTNGNLTPAQAHITSRQTEVPAWHSGGGHTDTAPARRCDGEPCPTGSRELHCPVRAPGKVTRGATEAPGAPAAEAWLEVARQALCTCHQPRVRLRHSCVPISLLHILPSRQTQQGSPATKSSAGVSNLLQIPY